MEKTLRPDQAAAPSQPTNAPSDASLAALSPSVDTSSVDGGLGWDMGPQNYDTSGNVVSATQPTPITAEQLQDVGLEGLHPGGVALINQIDGQTAMDDPTYRAGADTLALSLLNTPTAKTGEGLLLHAESPNPFGAIDPNVKYQDPVDAARKSLQANLSTIPTDDQTWSTTLAPRIIGSLIDPLTLAAGGVADVGLEAIPSVANLLEAGEGASLASRVVKGAIKGTALGAAGGAVSGGVQAAADAGTPQAMSLNDYMSNIANWAAWGAGGGVAGPVLGAVLSKVASKFIPTTELGDEMNVQNDPIVSRETFSSSLDSAIKQVDYGKKVDVSAMINADQNRAIDDLNAKQALYEALPDEQKQGIPSPMDQLQNGVDQAKLNLQDSESSINQFLNDIEGQYGSLDSEALSNEALKTPLPRLMETINKAKAATGLSADTQARLDTLTNTLKDNSYDFGPARSVQYALDNPPYLVSPDDREIIQALHDPNGEIEQIALMANNDLSDSSRAILDKRNQALQSYAEIPNAKRSNPLYASHLPNLNDALDDFADKQQDFVLAKANLDYKTAPKNDVLSDANRTMQNIISDRENLADPSQTVPMNEQIRDNEPYSQAPSDLGKMDDQIQSLKDQGLLSDKDMDEVNAVDEAEKNDEGTKSLLQKAIGCISRFGV